MLKGTACSITPVLTRFFNMPTDFLISGKISSLAQGNTSNCRSSLSNLLSVRCLNVMSTTLSQSTCIQNIHLPPCTQWGFQSTVLTTTHDWLEHEAGKNYFTSATQCCKPSRRLYIHTLQWGRVVQNTDHMKNDRGTFAMSSLIITIKYGYHQNLLRRCR